MDRRLMKLAKQVRELELSAQGGPKYLNDALKELERVVKIAKLPNQMPMLQPRSNLLRKIPPELRRHIWAHCAVNYAHDQYPAVLIINCKPVQQTAADRKAVGAGTPALLLTCRQIRHEALEYIISYANFLITARPRMENELGAYDIPAMLRTARGMGGLTSEMQLSALRVPSPRFDASTIKTLEISWELHFTCSGKIRDRGEEVGADLAAMFATAPSIDKIFLTITGGSGATRHIWENLLYRKAEWVRGQLRGLLRCANFQTLAHLKKIEVHGFYRDEWIKFSQDALDALWGQRVPKVLVVGMGHFSPWRGPWLDPTWTPY